MRLFAASTALLAIMACGGGSPTTGNPPPSGNPPASVAVQAGDAQQAEPGAVVAIKPAVIVKDASGQPVSGVLVSFAVDSGGGSLTGASATSGANGVATAGGWTLGAVEGRNVLKATVGTLAPVKIVATAMITGASFPPATLGPGGGSITVLQPGPLSGFKLDVPSGAYAGGMQATVSYASNVSIPRSPTVNPVSPLITISTTAEYSAMPLTIHISAPTPAGTFPVIMMYDPATGTSEPLTTIAWDANGVTAITNTLTTAHLLSNGSVRSNVHGASLMATGAVLYEDAMTPEVLLADYDSGFRPGVDDWEFQTTWTEVTRSSSQINTIGVPGTALWYFSARPSTTKLNGRFLESPGVPLSDRRGLRWAATVGMNYDVTGANTIIAGLSSRVADAAAFDANQLKVLRSRFAASAANGARPQAQLISGISQDGVPVFLIAYRVTGNIVFVADPYSPGDAGRFLEFQAGAPMKPYVTGALKGTTLTQPLVLGLTTLIPREQFENTYAQVLNKTIGNDVFPSYELHGWAGRLYDTLFVIDTLRWWVECPQCSNGFATTLSPPPSRNLVAQSVYDVGATEGLFFVPAGVFSSGATPAAGTDRPLGSVMVSAQTPQASSTGDKSWLDWHPYVLRRLKTSITPAAPTGQLTVPLKLKHQATLALLPANVRYRWDFGDGKPKVTVDNDPNIEHIYDAVGTFPVTGEIIDLRNSQVIARTTETATITLPHFVWVFQSVNAPTIVNPPGGIGSEHADTLIQALISGWMTTLRQTPSSGQIEMLSDVTCRGAFLAMPTTGGGLGPIKAYFGANCTDPDFIQSFTMGTLGNGTLTASAAASNADPDVMVLPGGSINATMTGPSLQGTIVWNVRYSTGIATYTFTFQAIQTLPVP